MRRLTTTALATLLLVACPSRTGPPGLPSCEELGCGGATVCLEGACRPRSCLELDCAEGHVCQPGPECRLATDDRDGDGVTAQLDCDDDDPRRFPGAADGCDGLDNDCDGVADDEATCPEGRRCCGTAGCVDPLSSHDNCGGCGSACGLYQECVDGLCGAAAPPIVTAVSPDPLPTGEWLGVEIAGEHLLGYATVFIEAEGGEADPFEVVATPEGTYATDQPIMLDGARLPAGPARLRLERNDGQGAEPFAIVVQGAARPVVTSFGPDPFPLAEQTGASVSGTGFWGAVKLFVAPDRTGAAWLDLPLLWVDSTWLRTEQIFLDPVEHEAGSWLAVVRNPDGVESEPYPFEVEAAPPPRLTTVAPAEGRLGEAVVLRVHGFDMFGPPTLLLAPERDPTAVLDPLAIDLFDPGRLVTAPFELAAERFSAGRYLLWVVNPDGSESNRLAFVVVG